MSAKELKRVTDIIVNPTGRIDIAPGLVRYEVQSVGTMMRWRLHILNHGTLASILRGNEDMAVEFRVDNGPKWREDLGKASSLFGRSGEISGETSLADGFDPSGVSVALKVTDPKDKRIVVKAGKSRPDAVTNDIELPSPEDPKPVKPYKLAVDEVLSMMDIRNSPNATGLWCVLLANQDAPVLLLNPRLPKSLFLAREDLVTMTLTGAVREVLTAIFNFPEIYDGETWFPVWKRFARDLSSSDELDLFEDLDHEQRRIEIETIVATFDAKVTSKVVFEAPEIASYEEE